MGFFTAADIDSLTTNRLAVVGKDKLRRLEPSHHK
jgi:hypothetical protein